MSPPTVKFPLGPPLAPSKNVPVSVPPVSGSPTKSLCAAADGALMKAVPPFPMIASLPAFGTPRVQLPAINQSPNEAFLKKVWPAPASVHTAQKITNVARNEHRGFGRIMIYAKWVKSHPGGVRPAKRN